MILTSHASKVILKILQARLQQHVNQKLPDVKAGFRKGTGTRDQIANICWIIEKAREFQKKETINKQSKNPSTSLTMLKPLTGWITTNWKILKEMGVPDHLTCLLRNPYEGQEVIVRTRHKTTDWFKTGKGICQGVFCHPAYLTFMQNTHEKCWGG